MLRLAKSENRMAAPAVVGWVEGAECSPVARRLPQPTGVGGANLEWLESSQAAPLPLENVPPLNPDILQCIGASLLQATCFNRQIPR